jgi:hypothetical protein
MGVQTIGYLLTATWKHANLELRSRLKVSLGILTQASIRSMGTTNEVYLPIIIMTEDFRRCFVLIDRNKS